MRDDYRYQDESGRFMSIGKMPTADIIEVLASGLELFDSDPDETPEAVYERLRIELVIRTLA